MDQYELVRVDGTVLKVDNWSETRISGGGSSASVGSSGASASTKPIKSTIIHQQRIYYLKNDNTEGQFSLQNVDFKGREGHKISIVVGCRGRLRLLLHVFNKNMNEHYRLHGNVNRLLPASLIVSFIIYTSIFCALVFLFELNRGIVGVGALIAIVLFALMIWQSTRRNKGRNYITKHLKELLAKS